MTNTVKEETPNPYNQNKTWHEGEDKPFQSSNSVYFEEPKNKLFKSDDLNNVEAEGSVNIEALESDKAEPYKRTNWKKRYDDMKKHYDISLNEFRDKEQELRDEVASNRPQYKAPKSPEELKQFESDYPDMFAVVETIAHMQSESKAKVLEERISKLQERETELVRQSAEERLMERHPDFQEIKNSDDFHVWAKEQPSDIQKWVYENVSDANLASRALDLFKKDMGMESSNTKSSSDKPTKGSAADMVSTKTTSVDVSQEKIWSEKEIAAMSMAEYDKYESAISEAWQEGRITK